MKLTGIFVYPIKSMAGISLNSVNLKEKGIHLDRRWMLVDGENRFICQRQEAKLALFTIEILDNALRVHWEAEELLIPFEESAYPEVARVWVFDDELTARIAGSAINEWFSKIIGIPCKLAHQTKESVRMTSSKYSDPRQVSFADGYPYLMTSQESLDFLNQKLETPVGMDRFRPNLVIEGGSPHIEDQFHFFKIGEVLLKGVKPCGRCKIVTINQTSLEIGSEPLKTLSTYRKSGNKVLFGQNLVLEKSDNYIINIGDKVEALDKKIQNN